MARVSRKENVQVTLKNDIPTKYKVAVYVRLSLENKDKANTLENQISLITTFTESMADMEVVQVYKDNGFTGTNFNRPAFLQMMEDVKAKKIDCIIVKDLSRFGRNYIEVGNYLENIFPFLDVRFIAITDGFDTLTAKRGTDGYIIPLKNLINHLYSRDISKKVGTALRNKQKNGEFLGAWAPYGYQKLPEHKTKIIIDEEVAQNVVKIFDLALEGKSYRQIVNFLNESNILSPSRYRYEKGLVKHEKFNKYQWTPSTVKNILCNPAYIGNMRCGMDYVSLHDNIPRKQMDESDWIITENTHEAIINKKTFEKVADIINKRAKKSRETFHKNVDIKSSESILRGLIFCKECGKPLSRKRYFEKSKKKQDELYYIYLCSSKTKSVNYCTFKTIREEKVLNVVYETLKNHIDCFLDKEKTILKLQSTSKFQRKKAEYSNRIRKLSNQISKNLTYRKALFTSYISKEITEKDYLSLSKDYELEHQELTKKLEDMADINTDILNENATILAKLKSLSSFEVLDREICLTLIEKIEISQDKTITIFLKYKNELNELVRWCENG